MLPQGGLRRARGSLLGTGGGAYRIYANWGDPSDSARWDWMVVSEGGGECSPEMIRSTLNKNLELNPKQRYLVELWPINGLGNPQEGIGGVLGATFLDYHCRPEVRSTILERMRATIRTALATITSRRTCTASA